MKLRQQNPTKRSSPNRRPPRPHSVYAHNVLPRPNQSQSHAPPSQSHTSQSHTPSPTKESRIPVAYHRRRSSAFSETSTSPRTKTPSPSKSSRTTSTSPSLPQRRRFSLALITGGTTSTTSSTLGSSSTPLTGDTEDLSNFESRRKMSCDIERRKSVNEENNCFSSPATPLKRWVFGFWDFV